jgi:hypothetical protein
MTVLRQTTQSHIIATLAPAGKAGTQVVISPSPAALATLTATSDASAFVDANGLTMLAWSASAAKHSDFTEAWELRPYIGNKYNQVMITKTGLWYNPSIGIASTGALAPASYLAAFAANMVA